MENIQCNEIMCACCKTALKNSDDLYVKISCGHEYHYDCIYDAFIFNRKRNATVLECPYCRLRVSHIPEKEGFDFDLTIHRGIVNSHDACWSKKHLGKLYCCYKMNDLYCNKNFIFGSGNQQKYCTKHKNTEFIGTGYCPILKGEKYCNIKCDDEKKYCYYHSKYENSVECDYIFQKGDKKGQLCAKLTVNNNSKCILHKQCVKPILNKTCVAIIKKGKNIGNMCGKKSYNDCDYCKTHFKLVNELNVINVE
jgi:hypothetical protein